MPTETVRLIGPAVEFFGSEASSTAQKRTYRLRDLAPAGLTLNPGGASPFPDETRIVSALVFDQHATPYPGTTSGRFSIGVDPFGRYCADSGFPLEERCWPDNAVWLGHVPFIPGVDGFRPYVHDPAVVVRPDDLIIVVPEVGGADGRAFQCGFSLGIESSIGRWQTIPGTVFRSRMSFDRQPTAGQDFCLRSLIPAISTGGTKVRVRWTAQASGMSPARFSIGVRSAGPNTVAAPVPLTLGGNPVVSLAPHRTAESDLANLVTQPGDELIVNASFYNGANAWAAAVRHDRVSWYVLNGPDSYASAAMLGSPVMQAGPAVGRTHCVDWVQVMP